MALQTAAHDGPVLFLALELSKSAWLLAAHLPEANKPKLHRIEAGDTAALLATITALRARVAGKFGTAVDVGLLLRGGP
jgi:transposase